MNITFTIIYGCVQIISAVHHQKIFFFWTQCFSRCHLRFWVLHKWFFLGKGFFLSRNNVKKPRGSVCVRIQFLLILIIIYTWYMWELFLWRSVILFKQDSFILITIHEILCKEFSFIFSSNNSTCEFLSTGDIPEEP